MKREWDLLREQLSTIEAEEDVLSAIPDTPKWTDDITEAEFSRLMDDYRFVSERVAGHLELLIDSGYVDGITVLRGAGGEFFGFSLSAPRLTMAGHDLLDTMRSQSVWDSIKATAKRKGIELTFDAIKILSGAAVKHLLGA